MDRSRVKNVSCEFDAGHQETPSILIQTPQINRERQLETAGRGKATLEAGQFTPIPLYRVASPLG
jgi:hypothetical protein